MFNIIISIFNIISVVSGSITGTPSSRMEHARPATATITQICATTQQENASVVDTTQQDIIVSDVPTGIMGTRLSGNVKVRISYPSPPNTTPNTI